MHLSVIYEVCECGFNDYRHESEKGSQKIPFCWVSVLDFLRCQFFLFIFINNRKQCSPFISSPVYLSVPSTEPSSLLLLFLLLHSYFRCFHERILQTICLFLWSASLSFHLFHSAFYSPAKASSYISWNTPKLLWYSFEIIWKIVEIYPPWFQDQ